MTVFAEMLLARLADPASRTRSADLATLARHLDGLRAQAHAAEHPRTRRRLLDMAAALERRARESAPEETF